MAWLLRLLIVTYTLALLPHGALAGEGMSCAHGEADTQHAYHCCDHELASGDCCDADADPGDPCAGCDHGTGWAVMPADALAGAALSDICLTPSLKPALSLTGPPPLRPPRSV